MFFVLIGNLHLMPVRVTVRHVGKYFYIGGIELVFVEKAAVEARDIVFLQSISSYHFLPERFSVVNF